MRVWGVENKEFETEKSIVKYVQTQVDRIFDQAQFIQNSNLFHINAAISSKV